MSEMPDPYTCPKCGRVWSEAELYEAVDDNEDTVIMLESCGRCPDCFEGDF